LKTQAKESVWNNFHTFSKKIMKVFWAQDSLKEV